MQRQFFSLSDDDEFCDDDTEFDLSTMSAIDYLKRVRRERTKIPEVVTVATETDCVQAEIDDTPSSYQAFTPEFGDLQKTKFEEMQNKIQAMRSDPSISLKLKETPELNNAAVDTDASIAFCESNEPKLSLCLTLTQNKLEDLLEILSNHFLLQIENPEFVQQLPHWITKWIYCLLCCLHFPLEPSLVAKLRGIARICIRVRNSLNSNSEIACETILPFNLIICLIALNFRQLDLLSL